MARGVHAGLAASAYVYVCGDCRPSPALRKGGGGGGGGALRRARSSRAQPSRLWTMRLCDRAPVRLARSHQRLDCASPAYLGPICRRRRHLLFAQLGTARKPNGDESRALRGALVRRVTYGAGVGTGAGAEGLVCSVATDELVWYGHYVCVSCPVCEEPMSDVGRRALDVGSCHSAGLPRL